MSGLEMMRLIAAITVVESNGNDLALNKKEQAWGSMQIRQMVLTDVNKAYKTNYQLNQMKNRSASHEVFKKYIKLYKADTTPEAASKCWNGGPRWRNKTGLARKNLDNYWNRVRKQMERKKPCKISAKKTDKTKATIIRVKKATVKPRCKT